MLEEGVLKRCNKETLDIIRLEVEKMNDSEGEDSPSGRPGGLTPLGKRTNDSKKKQAASAVKKKESSMMQKLRE